MQRTWIWSLVPTMPCTAPYDKKNSQTWNVISAGVENTRLTQWGQTWGSCDRPLFPSLSVISTPISQPLLITFLSSDSFLSFFFFFFNFYFYFILLYNTLLVLPYIDMNPPRVYMRSQSWTPLPPPSPYHPSGSSQCTSPKHPVSCIEPRWGYEFFLEVRNFCFKLN